MLVLICVRVVGAARVIISLVLPQCFGRYAGILSTLDVFQCRARGSGRNLASWWQGLLGEGCSGSYFLLYFRNYIFTHHHF
jgi:hypothetical protein